MLFGLQGRQEGMKTEDFQLFMHLLPCSLINNSNVAFALFSLALKLEVSPCQSRPKNKRLTYRERIQILKKRDVQCTEPWQKSRLYTKLPHSKEEIWKINGSKNFRRSNLFFLVALNTVLRVGQEGYGMKMDDFQLHVHLLPCSLMNNSNVAFALFALALKLSIVLSITAKN